MPTNEKEEPEGQALEFAIDYTLMKLLEENYLKTTFLKSNELIWQMLFYC